PAQAARAIRAGRRRRAAPRLRRAMGQGARRQDRADRGGQGARNRDRAQARAVAAARATEATFERRIRSDQADASRVAIVDGSVNANVEPTPTSLSTHIRPPCSSTNLPEIAMPSPVPSTFFG